MKQIIFGFVLITFSLCESNVFRCDYSYFDDIGWLKLHTIPKTNSDASYICYSEGAELVKPSYDKLKDIIIEILADRPEVDTSHTSIVSFDLNQNWTESTVIVLKEDGDYQWLHNTVNLPFICHKRADVEINKCGSVDNEYEFDNRTGHCYKFHKHHVTWYDAWKTCAIEGGTMAIINSDEEAQIIRDIFVRNPASSTDDANWNDMAFLGFLTLDGINWMTLNGLTIKEAGYDKFSPGEPNNARGDEFCGSVGRNGLLFDDPCTRPMSFICEKEIKSSCYAPIDIPFRLNPLHRRKTKIRRNKSTSYRGMESNKVVNF